MKEKLNLNLMMPPVASTTTTPLYDEQLPTTCALQSFQRKHSPCGGDDVWPLHERENIPGSTAVPVRNELEFHLLWSIWVDTINHGNRAPENTYTRPLGNVVFPITPANKEKCLAYLNRLLRWDKIEILYQIYFDCIVFRNQNLKWDAKIILRIPLCWWLC